LLRLFLAHHARFAAEILRRAAWLKVRTGLDAFAPLSFARRACWAATIFIRAAADTVRPDLVALVWMTPGRLRATKSSIARIA